MSGSATFARTTYRARVIAHIYVYIARRASSRSPHHRSVRQDPWFGRPTAIEVQANQALKAGAKMT